MTLLLAAIFEALQEYDPDIQLSGRQPYPFELSITYRSWVIDFIDSSDTNCIRMPNQGCPMPIIPIDNNLIPNIISSMRKTVDHYIDHYIDHYRIQT